MRFLARRRIFQYELLDLPCQIAWLDLSKLTSKNRIPGRLNMTLNSFFKGILVRAQLHRASSFYSIKAPKVRRVKLGHQLLQLKNQSKRTLKLNPQQSEQPGVNVMDLALHEQQSQTSKQHFSAFPKGVYPDEIEYMYIQARYYYSNYPRQNQTCVGKKTK